MNFKSNFDIVTYIYIVLQLVSLSWRARLTFVTTSVNVTYFFLCSARDGLIEDFNPSLGDATNFFFIETHTTQTTDTPTDPKPSSKPLRVH